MNLKSICLITVSCLLSIQSFAQPCTAVLTATHSPIVACTQRDLQLFATNIPGATYSWTSTTPFTSNLQNPVIPSISIFGTGTYTVTATVGPCVYVANVFVDVKITPNPIKPGVSYNGPKCVGEDIQLNGNTGGAPGITYHWSGPNGYNTTGQNPTLPNIQIADKGNYFLYAVSGEGCSTDTVSLFVDVHPPVKADFDFNLTLDCKEDRVDFTNKSTGDTTSFWTFGDGNTSTVKNPSHTYYVQPQTYLVKLRSENRYCKDSITKVIAINHPLKAIFTVDDDSICQNTTINFTNASVFTPATAPTYFWDFRDGANDNLINTSHKYTRFGEYDAMLIVTDYLGCEDTAYHHIVVDSTGAIVFAPEQDNLCVGQVLKFSGYYNPVFSKGSVWNMGDNNIIKNQSDIVHAYDAAGTYTVTYKASYRLCPDTTFTQTVTIKPSPRIDLGADRTICPGGNPVLLKDLVNAGDPAAKWFWNTDIINNTASMMVVHPGTYAATVDINGCTATDTVDVRKDCYINIPNAFTPNGDGNDDYFLPRELLSRSVSKFNMQVFNRWGQKVFESNTTNGRGWDGKFNDKEQPMAVYIYLIEASFLNGTSEKYQGNVTLIR